VQRRVVIFKDNDDDDDDDDKNTHLDIYHYHAVTSRQK